jgi:hypothetical protein
MDFSSFLNGFERNNYKPNPNNAEAKLKNAKWSITNTINGMIEAKRQALNASTKEEYYRLIDDKYKQVIKDLKIINKVEI